MIKFILLAILLLLSGISIMAQRNDEICTTSNYEDFNQLPPETVNLRKLSGQVSNAYDNKPFSYVCLLLFDEEKRLLKVLTPRKDGKFRFKNIPDGKYRLVVRNPHSVYCTANIAIQIDKKNTEKAELGVKLLMIGNDSCSYGELKTN